MKLLSSISSLLLLPLSIFNLLIVQNSSTLIIPKKLCKDCKFFIANKNECSKFGELDPLYGKHDYKYAKRSRENNDLCGLEAKYFEENNFKFITRPYYFVLEYGVFIIGLTPLTVLLFIYLYNLYNLLHN
jgi:hypothetical protein